MTRRQRKQKLSKQRAHQREQKHRKINAVREVMESLRRGKKKPTDKIVADRMEVRGYRPNGRGGWRRLSIAARNPSNRTLDKT